METFKKTEGNNFKKVIDLRTDQQAQEALEKTRKEHEEEIKLAEEFRRRRIVSQLNPDLKGDDDEQSYIEDRNRKKALNRYKDEPLIDFFKDQQPKIFRNRNDKSDIRRKRLDQTANWMKFTLMFLDADFITNITKLKRVSHRRVLLFLGNGEGIMGYGRGVGEDYRSAYANAIQKCKKNMIIINRDPMMTWPQNVRVKYNDYRLRIFSSKGGHYWGDPKMWMLLYLTGIYHCSFSIISRMRDPYSMMHAFFMAMTQNKKLKDIVETTGDKLYQYNIKMSSMSQHAGLV